MARKNFDYFDAFQRHAACGLEAARYLSRVQQDYNYDELMGILTEAHAIENKADSINREVHAKLRVDFVTPLEREDISRLSSLLDDITNEIEDIFLTFYMYHVKEIDSYMIQMTEQMIVGIDNLCGALENLPRFKKASEEMHPQLKAVNDAEEACDRLYLEAMHKLHDPENTKPEYELRAYDRVYGAFEDALDSIENTGEFIEEIIMTNL